MEFQDFPLSNSRVPDAETQARSFLTKYPENDGRNIVIAVMDTGCDPGAPGLQVTSHGLPKIIDVVDCTGSGDVDTSTVLEGLDLKGLSGRTLVLGTGERWQNPSGKWHVGVKAAYDLYDGELVKRMKKERKQVFEETHRGYITKAQKEADSFAADHPKVEGDMAMKKKEMEARVEQLNALLTGYADDGPMLDVVCWNDGNTWRAAVSSDGNFTTAPALANFVVEREWASLGEEEQMNYAINTYDEGCVVSVVCDLSSHGTHVAGIAAACHPEKPELNGVAPGAQVVSLRIGDNREHGMETGTGLCRAFAHCIQSKVDLINLSYGEAASPAATGRIIEMATKAVTQHGIIFVTSAGNSGPALSTIGAPGNGSDTYITVGAHVSPAAMETQYSMLDKVPATPYTWTSRGPTQDGSLGVTICAPGSAITSVPNWTLSGAQLMNGTSMASPNACGCIALVLSALKAAGQTWSSASIRRAIQATAAPLQGPGAEPLAVGPGMIQVDACFDYAMSNVELPYRDVTMAASIVGRGRGLYLREPHEANSVGVYQVKVKPTYRERDPSLHRAQIDLALNVAVTTNASWIKVPSYMVLTTGSRMGGFNISVDPTGLAMGQVHVEYVCGYDTDRPEIGPIFKVPITVVRPAPTTDCPAGQAPSVFKKVAVQYTPGHIERSFVEIPAGATWAEIVVKVAAFEGAARLFFLHAIQNIPHATFNKTQAEHVFRFTTAAEVKETMKVEGGGTLEVTLAQFWSCLGCTECDIEVRFHGVLADTRVVNLSSSNHIACVHTVSGPGAVKVSPSASLNVHRTSMSPKTAKVSALGERDLFPDNKQVYELVMEYSFKLDEDGEATPQVLHLNDKLYESPFESQLVQVFDHGKRFVGCTDAWPSALKLKKGEYTARLQVRHDDVALLNKLKGMSISLDRPLGKEIAVKAYPDFASALTGSGDFGTVKVKGSVRTPVFFALAVDEKLPEAVKPGDLLLGTACFGEPKLKPAGKDTLGGCVVQFAVAAPKFEEKKDEEEKFDPRSNEEKCLDAVRKAQLDHLATLRKWETREEHATLLDRLAAEYPDHLPVHVERLQAAEMKSDTETTQETLARQGAVVAAADAVVAAVDEEAIAAHLGRRIDKDDKEAVYHGKKLDEARDALVDALKKKVLALSKTCETITAESGGTDSAAFVQLPEAWKKLKTWADVGEAKNGRLVATYERAEGRLALALVGLNAFLTTEDKPQKDLFEERADLLEKLGWTQHAADARMALISRYPKGYKLF
jgi:tripeptidyl-peptidase-2